MVYFILDEQNRVKIGYSERNVQNRKKAGDTWNADKLTILGHIQGDIFTEHSIQRKFQKFQIKGEWFQFAPEIKEFLKSRGINSEE